MNLYAFVRYLKYRRAAKTRHGVHSPFVFDFIEKVLRPETNRRGGGMRALFKRFKGEAGHRKLAEDIFSVRLAAFAGAENIRWINDKDAGLWTPDYIEKIKFADTVIIVRDIHHTTDHSKAWQEIHTRPEVRLSIDLYHYGLLFFKQEFREKQHFTLRYPA